MVTQVGWPVALVTVRSSGATTTAALAPVALATTATFRLFTTKRLGCSRFDKRDACIPLRQLKLTPESLTVIEGMPTPPDTNEDIVQGAWDFSLINCKYKAAIELATNGRKLVDGGKPAEMRQWLADERATWMEAITYDPLLPEVLLPKGYLGQKALRERQSTFALLSRALARQNNK